MYTYSMYTSTMVYIASLHRQAVQELAIPLKDETGALRGKRSPSLSVTELDLTAVCVLRELPMFSLHFC